MDAWEHRVDSAVAKLHGGPDMTAALQVLTRRLRVRWRALVVVVTVHLGWAAAVLPLVAVVAIALLTLAYAMSRGSRTRSTRRTAAPVAFAARRPAAKVGLALGLSGRSGRTNVRSLGSTTLAVALATFITILVVSAVALTTTPARYGFDWDLIALNPYGDQDRDALEAMFGDSADVADASSSRSRRC